MKTKEQKIKTAYEKASDDCQLFHALAKTRKQKEMVTIYGQCQEWSLWISSAYQNAHDTDYACELGTDDEQAVFWASARSTLEMHIDQIQLSEN